MAATTALTPASSSLRAAEERMVKLATTGIQSRLENRGNEEFGKALAMASKGTEAILHVALQATHFQKTSASSAVLSSKRWIAVTIHLRKKSKTHFTFQTAIGAYESGAYREPLAITADSSKEDEKKVTISDSQLELVEPRSLSKKLKRYLITPSKLQESLGGDLNVAGGGFAASTLSAISPYALGNHIMFAVQNLFPKGFSLPPDHRFDSCKIFTVFTTRLDNLEHISYPLREIDFKYEQNPHEAYAKKVAEKRDGHDNQLCATATGGAMTLEDFEHYKKVSQGLVKPKDLPAEAELVGRLVIESSGRVAADPFKGNLNAATTAFLTHDILTNPAARPHTIGGKEIYYGDIGDEVRSLSKARVMSDRPGQGLIPIDPALLRLPSEAQLALIAPWKSYPVAPSSAGLRVPAVAPSSLERSAPAALGSPAVPRIALALPLSPMAGAATVRTPASPVQGAKGTETVVRSPPAN